MNLAEKKFDLYLTVLRFLAHKITENLRRIYLDFDMTSEKMLLTAFYQIYPSELELELLDDITAGARVPRVPNMLSSAKLYIYLYLKKFI